MTRPAKMVSLPHDKEGPVGFPHLRFLVGPSPCRWVEPRAGVSAILSAFEPATFALPRRRSLLPWASTRLSHRGTLAAPKQERIISVARIAHYWCRASLLGEM